MGKKHIADADLMAFHEKASKSTEGGKCLWGHKANYAAQSCSYRYQSHEKAKESSEKKLYHSYKDKLADGTLGEVDTSAYETNSGGHYPPYYSAKLEVPQDGDWDVEGPSRDIYRKGFDKKNKRVRSGKNFRKNTWPYWNEAHHVIPKATLLNVIDKRTESDPTCGVIVKQALMVAEYNVNHKRNMMFLPMDKEVAEVISLPRHLALKHSDGPGGEPETHNHKIYNDRVQTKLVSIVNKYIKKVEEARAKGAHPELNADLDKTKLEKLSDKLRKMIVKFGKSKGGMPLTSIPVSAYR